MVYFAIAMTLLVLSLKVPNISYPAKDNQILNSVHVKWVIQIFNLHKFPTSSILVGESNTVLTFIKKTRSNSFG